MFQSMKEAPIPNSAQVLGSGTASAKVVVTSKLSTVLSPFDVALIRKAASLNEVTGVPPASLITFVLEVVIGLTQRVESPEVMLYDMTMR